MDGYFDIVVVAIGGITANAATERIERVKGKKTIAIASPPPVDVEEAERVITVDDEGVSTVAVTATSSRFCTTR